MRSSEVRESYSLCCNCYTAFEHRKIHTDEALESVQHSPEHRLITVLQQHASIAFCLHSAGGRSLEALKEYVERAVQELTCGDHSVST